jgi:hypothetical protein
MIRPHRPAKAQGEAPMFKTIREDRFGRFELFQPDVVEEIQIMAEAAQAMNSVAAPTPATRLLRLLASVRACATLH